MQACSAPTEGHLREKPPLQIAERAISQEVLVSDCKWIGLNHSRCIALIALPELLGEAIGEDVEALGFQRLEESIGHHRGWLGWKFEFGLVIHIGFDGPWMDADDLSALPSQFLTE